MAAPLAARAQSARSNGAFIVSTVDFSAAAVARLNAQGTPLDATASDHTNHRVGHVGADRIDSVAGPCGPRRDACGQDTIGIIRRGADRRLTGACTMSGMAFRIHGRVGASHRIGAGLFVAADIRAATAMVASAPSRYCAASPPR